MNWKQSNSYIGIGRFLQRYGIFSMKFVVSFLVIITVLFFIFPVSGQVTILRDKIYFETAKSELTIEGKTKLNNLLDSLRNFKSYKIFIKGYTDNIGDSAFNKTLSEKRVNKTVDYFLSNGVLKAVFTTAAFGEEKPIADNMTEQGKQMNRRVDILISFIRKVPVDSSQFLSSIWELYEQIETQPQQFYINPNSDTVLQCEKGTLLYIKANSFKILNGCKTKNITIKVKEDFLKSDIILDNLSTTSNGKTIETQGMVYTEANDCKGNKLNLIKGKDVVIYIPTDTIISEAKIFDGKRTPHDSIMNWTVSNTSVLECYTIEEINVCSDLINQIDFNRSCTRCKFFFCRIKRIGLAFKGIRNKEIHQSNIEFRACQKRLRKELRQAKKLKRQNRRIQPSRTAVRQSTPSILPPNCEKLKELYEKYGVTNLNALIEAINKPLMDSLGVKTIQELRDTITKIKINNVEISYLNKKISYNDFKYYVFNTSKLGWKNIDVFAEFSKSNLIDLKVDLKFAKNVDCKIVFIDRRIVIPSKATEGNYVFEGLPKGEKIYIVALKYDNGKPYLSMEQTTIDNRIHNVNFKFYTIEELKKELGKLNE